MTILVRAPIWPIAALVAAAAVHAAPKPEPSAAPDVRFADTAAKLAPPFEITGFSFMPGVAMIDYDGDSWTDIYAVSGKGSPNALYRNNRDGTFTDMAASAGVADLGQGMALAVGDLNNDGWDDLYLGQGTTIGDGLDSADGMDRLFLNLGNGTFRDIAATAGILEPGVTTSVSMADYDADGDLDIFVGRFIDFDFLDPTTSRSSPHTTSKLYRNNGDLTFTDVTEQAGVGGEFNTWASTWFDYDDDGDIDLFVAREQGPVTVYRNDGDGRFSDVTMAAGDLSAYGAWNGIAVGDYDNDGDLDLYLSNISDLRVTRHPSQPPLPVPPPETWDNPWPALFRNNGDGTFTDAGREAGVSFGQEFSWGTFFADLDNDGWQDIYLAQNFAPSGVIGRETDGAGPGRLFINQRNGAFADATALSGVANVGPSGDYLDARGAAYADFNKDGGVDFFLQNAPQFVEPFPFGSTPIPGTGLPRLFANQSTTGNHWIQLRLVGTGASNRNAFGAKVRLRTDDLAQVRQLASGGSSYSEHERILHFGLGKAKSASVEIVWPDGEVQRFNSLSADRRWTLTQGSSGRVSEAQFESQSASRINR